MSKKILLHYKKIAFPILYCVFGAIWLPLQGQIVLNTTAGPGDIKDPYSIRMLPGFSFDSKAGGTFRAYIDATVSNGGTPFSPITPSYPSALPTTENYIYTREYLVPVTSETASAQQVQSIQFFDGLGRPKQSVAIKASPTGKDIVTHIPYDAFGRQVESWLPVPLSSQSGGIHDPASVTSNATSVYADAFPYAKKVLENSPLDRLLQQIQPGNDWQSKPVNFGYDANSDSEVKKFSTTTTWVENRTTSTLVNGGYYNASSLYKNTTTDEDGNISIEYKNGQGQTLLVKKMLGTTPVETYYVYNEYDQLAFVIPPKAVSNPTDSTVLNELIYHYRYDGKARLVEKKLPGKDWEYLVYDNHDRLVMTQDAALRAQSQWLFTKYDAFGRVVYTGIASGGTRATVQSALNTRTTPNHETTSATALAGNTHIYYTNTAYPTAISKFLSANYYDAYPIGTPTLPATIQSQTLLTPNAAAITGATGLSSIRSTKGLPTASFVKNIDQELWTKSYTYYDTKGRVIATHSYNHLGGFTRTESKLKFSGKPEYTLTTHSRNTPTATHTLKDSFVYDHQERIGQHKQQINGGAETVLTENILDDFSRLKNKNVGGSGTTALQVINYAYNIRGWLTKVNNPAQLGNKLFAFEIKYQNPNTSSTNAQAKYNGNISQIDWASNNDAVLRRYTYQYDAMNRLTNAYYSKPNTTTPITNAYNEYLTYDINGNISTLQRFGDSDGISAIKIDELAYTYENGNMSNKLAKVVDYTNNESGYKGNGNAISYDANGNMTSHTDKGISSIAYNYLNLPKQVVTNGKNVEYLYRADGVKLKKTYNGVITDYLDGFQYENGALQFFPTAEGYYDLPKSRYVYNYTDHLGNVRVSYYKENGTIKLLEENNYYPFGLKHGGYNNIGSNPAYNYKYNGKELQTESQMYDYGARFYMPDIGRWGVLDPLVEKTMDPYNYVWNNPIEFIDPDGMDGTGTTSRTLPEPTSVGERNGDFVAERNENGKLVWTLFKVKNIDEVIINTPKAIANQNFYEAQSRLNSAIHSSNIAQGWGNVENFLFQEIPMSLAVGEFISFGWNATGLGKVISPYFNRGINKIFGNLADDAANTSSNILLNTSRQLQAKFKHAGDFGIVGNYSKANANKFSSAINQHINSAGVQTINGTYRGQSVIHYINPNTGLNVISSPSGQFISGWKLNSAQLQNVLQHGGL